MLTHPTDRRNMDLLFTFLQTNYNEQIEVRVIGTPEAIEKQIEAVERLLDEMKTASTTLFGDVKNKPLERKTHFTNA